MTRLGTPHRLEAYVTLGTKNGDALFESVAVVVLGSQGFRLRNVSSLQARR